MHPSKKVTIITAVFNAEPYLRSTVNSVALQTYRPLEQILIDDGSTDNSLALSKELAKEFPHVSVIAHDVNKGYPSALNTGIAAATTDYIAILDSDDIAMPHWLETVVPVLDSNPQVGAAGGGCVIMTEIGEITGYRKYCDVQGDVTDAIANNKYLILHPGTVHRKSVLQKIGGYNPQLKSLQDTDVYLGISSVAKLFHVGVPLIYYRRLSSSGSRKTGEFYALGNDYRESKAKMLKSGLTVAEANRLLQDKLNALNEVPRLEKINRSSYELEMARAFQEGGQRLRAIHHFISALRRGAGFRSTLRGISRCLWPRLVKRKSTGGNDRVSLG